ncbi:hypothetical protein [uncultured Mucilaginibacter sp.]|uniref:hypothetical protein n=1 Tax=uncultured Mucilaginibacter sp. TaxID=797541 RepID=UPI0025EAB44F|nr:hypothetical protein [uncultured Mucilaginibacter sp.]
MAKKAFLIVVILSIMYSCKQPELKPTNKDKFVVGTWTLCQIIEYSEGKAVSGLSFNVCPEVNFFKNHSGFIKRSDPKQLQFSWSLRDTILTLKHALKENNNDVIDDGTYVISHPTNKKFEELDLLDSKKHTKYILGR